MSELRSRLDIRAEKSQEAFMEALAKLGSLEGKKLLVLDDVKDIKENQEQIDRILALKYCGYQILLTSRKKIKNTEIYLLDTLNPNDAKELFLKYYNTNDIAKVKQIVKYLDYHAL